MKIPAFKLVHGVPYPLYILDFVRCPDGIYAVVVLREPRTTNEQIPQPLALSQVVIDRDWIVEPVEKPVEKVEKPKKVLNESETKTAPKTTKSTKSTSTKSTAKTDK